MRCACDCCPHMGETQDWTKYARDGCGHSPMLECFSCHTAHCRHQDCEWCNA